MTGARLRSAIQPIAAPLFEPDPQSDFPQCLPACLSVYRPLSSPRGQIRANNATAIRLRPRASATQHPARQALFKTEHKLATCMSNDTHLTRSHSVIMNFLSRACFHSRVSPISSLSRSRSRHRTHTTAAVNGFVVKSHVMHRALRSEPQSIVSGSGISFTLANGKTLIDASSGPAVSCLGHHRPEVAKAVADQINKIGYVYSIGYTSDAAEELATMLLQDKPGGLSRAMFFNSGSEATDAAIKLATQYWKEKGEPQRRNVISRAQSYHGNTIGALCVSGAEARRAMYSDWMSNNVTFVDPCYAYRAKPEGQSDEEYLAGLVKQLDGEFQRLGPDTVSAFFAETISGTTLGCLPALPGYFKAVRELCDKYGALLILDEVGGRSSRWMSGVLTSF